VPGVAKNGADAALKRRPRLKFGLEAPLPTVRFEDLPLTSTRSADNTGVRVQVLRRQPDGSWLRIIDRPEVPPA
jgi:hypothetical protein